MPWWKYAANRFLTKLENAIFGLNLAEYHTGYRAFRRDALDHVNLDMNSDNFIFDQEIIAQLVNLNMRIAEVPGAHALLPGGLFSLVRAEFHLWPVDSVAASQI